MGVHVLPLVDASLGCLVEDDGVIEGLCGPRFRTEFRPDPNATSFHFRQVEGPQVHWSDPAHSLGKVVEFQRPGLHTFSFDVSGASGTVSVRVFPAEAMNHIAFTRYSERHILHLLRRIAQDPNVLDLEVVGLGITPGYHSAALNQHFQMQLDTSP